LVGGAGLRWEVVASDGWGHLTRRALELTVAPDLSAPVVGAVTFVRADRAFRSGETISVSISASDDVAVSSISVTIGSTTKEIHGLATATLDLTAPEVATTTVFPVAIQIRDIAGNLVNVTPQPEVTVNPADVPGKPTIAAVCPSGESWLPSGYSGFTLRVTTTDDVGVARVDFYRGLEVTPFKTVTPAGPGLPTALTASSDAMTLDSVLTETVVDYRVVVSDSSTPTARTAEAVIRVHVVPTTDLLDAGQSDPTLTEKFVVVRSGTVTLDGDRTFGGLIVLPGGSLKQTATNPPSAFTITVGGPVYVACGGSIDYSGTGYVGGTSYPGLSVATDSGGGSHIGGGGPVSGVSPSTFGSVYRPREAGGGQGANGGITNGGGGALKLEATGSVRVDGLVGANGSAPGSVAGAGGSVWIRAVGTVTGSGSIEAQGGELGANGGGGGGAIAVEWGAVTTEALPKTTARAGKTTDTSASRNANPGTIYLKGPSHIYGDLLIDNERYNTPRTSDLPAFGSGTAANGTSGTHLVLATAVPGYFSGHWVRVFRGGTETPRGYYRISQLSADGLTADLAPEGEASSLEAGDRYEGVYRFDSIRVRRGTQVQSNDPMTASALLVEGGEASLSALLRVRRVDVANLTIGSRGSLTPLTAGGPQELELLTSGDVVVSAGGLLDLSAFGATWAETYPGATKPGNLAGGSHIGKGGDVAGWGLAGTTFGSLSRPREPGAGATGCSGSNSRGGGVLRLIAGGEVSVGGTIRANGEEGSCNGAGGSLWITADRFGGSGTVEARGGDLLTNGGGGGGAVAAEWRISGSTIPGFIARGGNTTYHSTRRGAAGSVFLKAPSSVYGTLIIDNGNIGATATTVLPSLGTGVAGSGSAGSKLEISQTADVADFFVGHWIKVTSSGGTVRGAWRIGAIDNWSATTKQLWLMPNDRSGEPAVLPGDTWRGMFRLDASPTIAGGALVASGGDPIVVGEVLSAAAVVGEEQESPATIESVGPALQP
jgi:hypothetical protein